MSEFASPALPSPMLPPRPAESLSGRSSGWEGIWPLDLGTAGPRLWWADLDRLHFDLDSLDAQERERAQRFVRPILQHRFQQSRAALRAILARELGCAPQEVRFGYGDRGKPYVLGSYRSGVYVMEPEGSPDLRLSFNISHSERGWLCGLGPVTLESTLGSTLESTLGSTLESTLESTLGPALGVDLEQVRPVPEAIALARRFFAPEEVALLEAIAPEARGEAFLRLWVCKEAVLKATGTGIAEQLATTVIRWDATGPQVTPPEELASLGGWVVRDVTVGPEWVGAIAYRKGSIQRL